MGGADVSYIVRMVDTGQMLTCRPGCRTDYGMTLLITLPDGRMAEVEYTGPDEPEPVQWFDLGVQGLIEGSE